jgi:hypothetical protein
LARGAREKDSNWSGGFAARNRSGRSRCRQKRNLEGPDEFRADLVDTNHVDTDPIDEHAVDSNVIGTGRGHYQLHKSPIE